MTATLIGATGLIGNYLLEELLQDDYFDKVKILIRRPMEFSHPKLEKKLVDFNDGDSMLVALSNSDVVFCSIGTTQKKVKGDKDAYRKIDYDIAVNAARFSKMVGCETLRSLPAAPVCAGMPPTPARLARVWVRSHNINTARVVAAETIIFKIKNGRTCFQDFIGSLTGRDSF